MARYIVARMVGASGLLSVASYFILAALLDGPRHGYGIIKRAAELSDGRVRLPAGTLYGALERLAERRLVLPDQEEVVQGRTRRYYHLTDQGLQALTERRRIWSRRHMWSPGVRGPRPEVGMSKRLERRCRWLLLGGLRTRARQASGLFHAAEYLGEGGASTSALVYLAVVALLTGSLAAVALGVRRTQLTRR